MMIDLAAFSTKKLSQEAAKEKRGPKVDYPKSEPVLESSYIFPKVESSGGWKFEAPGVIAISQDC